MPAYVFGQVAAFSGKKISRPRIEMVTRGAPWKRSQAMAESRLECESW